MNFNFDIKINNFLKIILKNAQKFNFRVFFVGGIVRDNLLNINTKDIDILILGNAIEFCKYLPKEIKIKSIHKDFSTVKVEYEKTEIDIASTRSEKYPYSGCLPVVKKIGVNLDSDVSRRDFSVNSIYCELLMENGAIKYQIIDLINGINDIKNKTLRVLHDKSYIDDPTRIVRGFGFKHRFNFDFSENDIKLTKNYLSNIDYSNMSHARNLKVLNSVLDNQYGYEIFKDIIANNVYKIINPDDVMVDFNLLDEAIYLFELNHTQRAQLFVKIIQNNFQNEVSCNSYLDIKNNFSKFDLVDLSYYFYKTFDKNVLIYKEIKDIKLNINGNTLIGLGYSQGKRLGFILNKLLEKKLEKPYDFNKQDDEIAWVLKEFPQK